MYYSTGNFPYLCSFHFIQAEHENLQKLVHSLDVWHKAKILSKKLHKAAQDKNKHELKDWIGPIVNHFWYSCESSDGNETKLKDTFLGVLHHICGEHEWAGSSC